MKLYLGQKRKREILLWSVGFVCGVLIWWAQAYDPIHEQKNELATTRERLTAERAQLAEKQKKLVEFIAAHKSIEQKMSRFEGLKVEGKTIEALSATTQAILQQYLDKQKIPIKAYKELPAAKWRGHAISQIELQFETKMQGLTDLLNFLESLNKVVRVDRLTIMYRHMKDSDLFIVLQVATLQMEGLSS